MSKLVRLFFLIYSPGSFKSKFKSLALKGLVDQAGSHDNIRHILGSALSNVAYLLNRMTNDSISSKAGAECVFFDHVLNEDLPRRYAPTRGCFCCRNLMVVVILPH